MLLRCRFKMTHNLLIAATNTPSNIKIGYVGEYLLRLIEVRVFHNVSNGDTIFFKLGMLT
jgi:hypothetical protein